MDNINSFDVCVIGAGPAGMVSAIELAESGLSVALVESGGEQSHSFAQELSKGEILSPDSHSDMADAVWRGLGGTSELWGGRCVPLDNVDFITRSNVDLSGWPISHAELDPYYQSACSYLGVKSPEFTVDSCKNMVTSKLPLSSKFSGTSRVLASQIERWSMEPKIWRVLGDKIKKNKNITLFKNKTCVGFVQSQGLFKVTAATLRATHKDGSEIEQVFANVFILACGGVESTRLVLSSIEDLNGLKVLGSRHVGHFYMGHPSGKIADIQLFGNSHETIYGFEKDGDVYVRRRITFSEETLKKEQLLNIAFWLDNPNISDWRHGSGILSAAYLALTAPFFSHIFAPAAIRKRVAGLGQLNRFEHLKNCVFNPLETFSFVIKFLFRRYFSKPRLPGFFTYSKSNKYALHYHAEQVPSYDSCISLSEKKDALGLKRAVISLVWSQKDIDSIIKAHKVLDDELKKNGIGQLVYKYSDGELDSAIRAQALDGFHQIGTLRMANSHEQGVTDKNGLVFGTDNFYIASSAIFPTSGQANPTLALVALVIRQANHISNSLKSKG
jgi:hypothetical protein